MTAFGRTLLFGDISNKPKDPTRSSLILSNTKSRQLTKNEHKPFVCQIADGYSSYVYVLNQQEFIKHLLSTARLPGNVFIKT